MTDEGVFSGVAFTVREGLPFEDNSVLLGRAIHTATEEGQDCSRFAFDGPGLYATDGTKRLICSFYGCYYSSRVIDTRGFTPTPRPSTQRRRECRTSGQLRFSDWCLPGGESYGKPPIA